MSYFERLPWHAYPWELLQRAKQKNHLPHALLFLGVPGLGRKNLSVAFAHSVLCQNSNLQGDPCADCQNCHLIRAHSHPDLILIEPEEKGLVIKVDQIREIVYEVNTTPLVGHARIIIINPAHAMNSAAANALLKTLEEPPPHTMIILITDLSQRMPATILSRCQKITFPKPDQTSALDWLLLQHPTVNSSDLLVLLHFSQQAPLLVRDWLKEGTLLPLRKKLYDGLMALSQKTINPLQLAAQCEGEDLILILKCLLYWLQDLLRCQLTDYSASLINTDYVDQYKKLKVGLKRILRYLTVVEERFIKITFLQNLNRQLLLEEVLIGWTECYDVS